MRRVVREDRRLNDELAEQNRRTYHDIASSYPLYFFDHFFTFFWPFFWPVCFMKMSRLRCEAARSKRWKVPAVSSTPNPKNEDGEKKPPLARPGKPRKCMCVTIICMSYIYGIIYIMYVCLWCTVFLYDISTYIRVYHASFCDVWLTLLLLYYFTVLL